ncbi:WD tetratricopeptide repeat domain-containing protein [Zalerion maritima]|uniref:WD tetratricopeptide repeat domain-containing protein n=1 Tax=Zalerion maritima TaxID=339359 RepID=A0AAD5WWS0_9PEZI|nr:WD tetratricopeptide repeat domain-containing protein [Zalerion maritima]
MDSEESADGNVLRMASLLEQREILTDELVHSPYDLITYLRRAIVYADLAYPDLAAGDAYRALLLTDEVLNESFEYHRQSLQALYDHSVKPLPDVLQHGDLSAVELEGMNHDVAHNDNQYRQLAMLASVRCFQVLSLSLLLCGSLRSASSFCQRGLGIAPHNRELLETKTYIRTMAQRRLRKDHINLQELPDHGMVRREVYPWNRHEPNRFSDEALTFLNNELAIMAPKCVVQVAQLPILLEGASETDDYAIIPTCNQLGLFARENIEPGETVLKEYSLLTASNRHKESVCDACSAELPPLGVEPTAVACEECYDTVFCSEYCHQKAKEQYHPAVCEKDVDSIAKDTDSRDADDALYLLLLARVLAMSTHQESHPLEIKDVKYICGDFVPSHINDINLSPNAGPPPEWTLPFSFKYNIETPLHILEKMDVDIYATMPDHDLWVLNTLYGKLRGTASARKNPRDGRPDVAAVHPFWCLANHDCNPNVTWEWGGQMALWARDTKVDHQRGGLKRGQEVLSHYCDVTLPVQERREWAKGSLGGWCMCDRCRSESAAAVANGVVS